VGEISRKYQSEVSRLFKDVVSALPVLVHKATGRLQPWLICNLQFHDDTLFHTSISPDRQATSGIGVQFQGNYA
jgi:hypothetical protein